MNENLEHGTGDGPTHCLQTANRFLGMLNIGEMG
jgi:hypothetical protein